MIKHWTSRLLIGLACGLSFALFTITVTHAKPQAKPMPQTALPDDCGECHENIVVSAEASQHGQAFADPAFQESWLAQDSPPECLACHTTGYDAATHTWEEEGVGCSTCHEMGPNSTHHPEQVMPVNRSSEACGTCHVDTHEDWAMSKHGEEDLACVKCHNPHTAELKKENVQEVCIDCHNEESYFYAFTAHSQEGMICTDCHFQVSETPAGEGHGKLVHTFAVDLNNCNQCHEHQMHSTSSDAAFMGTMGTAMGGEEGEGAAGVTPCEALDTLQQARNDIVFPDQIDSNVLAPEPPSGLAPLSFVLPMVFGLALGIVVTPLAERAFRRVQI
jgi:predicted CXXCH cytochrome family protein